jgi:hypothetical protein
VSAFSLPTASITPKIHRHDWRDRPAVAGGRGRGRHSCVRAHGRMRAPRDRRCRRAALFLRQQPLAEAAARAVRRPATFAALRRLKSRACMHERPPHTAAGLAHCGRPNFRWGASAARVQIVKSCARVCVLCPGPPGPRSFDLLVHHRRVPESTHAATVRPGLSAVHFTLSFFFFFSFVFYE